MHTHTHTHEQKHKNLPARRLAALAAATSWRAMPRRRHAASTAKLHTYAQPLIIE
jgi:hypothetical protein